MTVTPTGQRLAVFVAVALVAAGVLSFTGSSAPAGEPSSRGVPAELPSPARPISTGTASCSDPAGDPRVVGDEGAPAGGTVPGTDLRSVELAADGERFHVRFVSEEPVPRDATAIGGDVELPVQWVLWILDGEEIAYHLRAVLRADGWELVRDDLEAEPVVTRAAPAIDGPALRFDVALADLPRLPAEFGWVALTTHGDVPVQDVCPDAANDSLAPDVQLRFPEPS